MTILTNIKTLGRFRNKETGKEYNIKRGRNMRRGTNVLYYLRSGSRVFISDSDFYSTYIKVE